MTPEARARLRSILDDPSSWNDGAAARVMPCDEPPEAQQLREVSRHYEAVFDASARALTVFDRERRVIKFNQVAADLAHRGWGVSYEEGQSLSDTGFAREHLEAFDAGLDVVFGGKRVDIEWSGENICGDPRQYEVSFVPLRGVTGEVESALIVGEDVTTKRQDERDRARLETHLANAQRVEALGIMASGIAHDFNNMFMLLLTHASMIELELEAESAREDAPEFVRRVVGEVAEIEQTIMKAKGVTTQLLEFAGRQLVEPASILPASALEGCVLSTRRLMPPDIVLELEPSESTWRVVLDPGQLDQLLKKLVLNARDAFDGGDGKITLRVLEEVVHEERVLNGCVLRPGEYVVLEVEDDGCGISAHDVPRIFDPFFTTRRRGGHTGLGLASCFGIARGANGAIECSSTVGEGTTFHIWLPHERPPATARGHEQPGDLSGVGRRRVLLAEDQEDLRDALERILDRYGFEVVSCADGEEVIETLKVDRDFALLLTDVVMPNLGGVEAAKAFSEVNPNAPVVFMSGYVDDMLLSHQLVQGATVVQKPCLPRKLIEILEEALDDVSR